MRIAGCHRQSSGCVRAEKHSCATFHEYLWAAPTPVLVRAPGMVNVEVWTYGEMAIRLTPDFKGNFKGTLDLSQEPNGPLALAIYAWNVPPGGTATVSLAARETVFLHHSKKALNIPFPAGASGMKLAWSDEFNTLSATPCKPNTGTWPKCAHPTAADGFTWYEKKPNGGDFGDAAFEHTDSPYNPYTIMDGFLRVRSTYDPAYLDPYGWKRHWRSGLLASAFPDGSTNAPSLADGYYETRILVPHAATGPNNKNASGGTWPAFWMMDLNEFKPGATGALEIDMTEEYGNDE